MEHHRLRRHVDAERERLRRKEELQEARGKEALDDLLVHGQHARVVVAHAARGHAPQPLERGRLVAAVHRDEAVELRCDVPRGPLVQQLPPHDAP